METTNRAYETKGRLSSRHYYVLGTGATYFTQFAKQKLGRFKREFGSDFCLVVLGDYRDPDDFYVIPWTAIADGFSELLLQKTQRSNGYTLERWVCHIRDGRLDIAKDGVEPFRYDVSPYKGRSDLLA